MDYNDKCLRIIGIPLVGILFPTIIMWSEGKLFTNEYYRAVIQATFMTFAIWMGFPLDRHVPLEEISMDRKTRYTPSY